MNTKVMPTLGRQDIDITSTVSTLTPTEASHLASQAEVTRKLTEVEGTTMGDMLMLRVSAAKAEGSRKNQVAIVDKEIEAFLQDNDVARQFKGRHPWFGRFLKAIIRNSIKSKASVSTKLEHLSKKEAIKIGASLPITILSNVNAESGVEEWISLYPALLELDDSMPWFRPMMNSMAFSLLKDGVFGLKVRVGFGALLSYFDMGSDIFMIYRFAQRGKFFYAYGTLISICINLFLQCYFVYICNHRRGRKIIFQEIFITLAFMKPAVDAFRIATDAKTDDLSMFEQLHEAAISRATEVLAESLPASIILMSLIVETYTSGAPKEMAPLLSMTTSILTVGYIVALMSFDIDTSPANRKKNNELYGT
jgi:hypothetical protein